MADYGTILSDCLQSPFKIENYRTLIVNFLNGTTLKPVEKLRSAEIFAEYSYYVQGFALVGEYIDPNRNRVGIYAVKLNAGRDIEKARSKQRNFIAKLLADNNFDAAIAAFYLNEDSKWRLSFVRLDYEFAKGKVSKNLTPAKRYSYLVGKDEPCHTAMESLLPIFAEENFKPTIDSIEQAFSIEKVTKQFFEKYKEKYIELKEFLECTPCFVEESTQRGFSSEQYAKKLMGQIVFLYFLQKKGWLGVNALPTKINEKAFKSAFYYNATVREILPNIYIKIADDEYKLNGAALKDLTQIQEEYLARAIKGNPWGTGSRTFVRNLFNYAKKRNGNFFDEYLEPLFYQGLNKKRDADNYYAPLHCRIPFLNGGLFEPLDNYDWENNFFSIPNEMFSNADIKGVREADGILDIFDRYNFTMNEDEPLEKEVAVDPEMLGKIFENLLDVTDRKSKGAFYTPREIVHYMCQESLTNYIVNTVGTPYEDTKDFVVYGEIMKDEDCSRESTYGFTKLLMSDSIYKNLNAIDNALADVRVADPAVGSGAFPMGMLSEIVKLREIITEYMARDLCLLPQYKGIEKAGALRAAIWKLRNETRNSYNLKKETMRNCIYAVDIEPSAVDIAKLRLWLTLVVEQEIDPNDPYNDSPVALPNLDCNIMCGNSLIDEFEGIDLSFDDVICNDTVQTSIVGNSVETDLEKMFKLQHDYFYADNHDDKFKLKQEIEAVKERILSLAFTSASEDKKRRFEVANSLHSTPFFLWKLNFAKVFKEKGGFDIVIGNPPYLAYKKIDMATKTLYNKRYQCSTGQYDLYGVFFERGYALLKNIGNLSFITSSTYFNNKDFILLRKFLLQNSKINFIVNLDESIFETAQLDVAIIGFTKEIIDMDSGNNIAIYKDKQSFENKTFEIRNQKEFFKVETSYEIKLKCDNTDEQLIKKINLEAILLEKILDLPRGIEIGGNSSLIINEPREGYEKLLVGRNLKKYGIDFKELYIRYDDKNISCFKDYSIYHQPKILIQRIRNLSLKQRIVATIDLDNYLCTNTLRIGNLINKDYDLYYILGIINSNLINWMFLKYFLNKDIYSYQLKQIPIKIKELAEQNYLSEMVKQIILANKANNLSEFNILNDKINRYIYKLYKLTDEEIALVEGTIK